MHNADANSRDRRVNIGLQCLLALTFCLFVYDVTSGQSVKTGQSIARVSELTQQIEEMIPDNTILKRPKRAPDDSPDQMETFPRVFKQNVKPSREITLTLNTTGCNCSEACLVRFKPEELPPNRRHKYFSFSEELNQVRIERRGSYAVRVQIVYNKPNDKSQAELLVNNDTKPYKKCIVGSQVFPLSARTEYPVYGTCSLFATAFLKKRDTVRVALMDPSSAVICLESVSFWQVVRLGS